MYLFSAFGTSGRPAASPLLPGPARGALRGPGERQLSFRVNYFTTLGVKLSDFELNFSPRPTLFSSPGILQSVPGVPNPRVFLECQPHCVPGVPNPRESPPREGGDVRSKSFFYCLLFLSIVSVIQCLFNF